VVVVVVVAGDPSFSSSSVLSLSLSLSLFRLCLPVVVFMIQRSFFSLSSLCFFLSFFLSENQRVLMLT
jgi:hypothetical protein